MYWRFLHVANSKQKYSKKKSPEMPPTSLDKLAVKTERYSEEIDWKTLHHEVGQIGLGRWGQMCVEQFRCVKNTRQYQRWIMQRRRHSSMTRNYQPSTRSSATGPPGSVDHPNLSLNRSYARCNVCKRSGTFTSFDPELKDYDSDYNLDSSLELNSSLFSDTDDTGGDVSITQYNDSSVETKLQDDSRNDRKEEPECGDLENVQAGETHPRVKPCTGSSEHKVLGSPVPTGSPGVETEKELFEKEKNLESDVDKEKTLESDVDKVLTAIVDDVCRSYMVHVVRNVIRSIEEDVNTGRLDLEYDRESSLPSLSYEEPVMDVAMTGVEPGLYTPDPVSPANIQAYDKEDVSVGDDDLSLLYKESIDYLDAVIQEHDDSDDIQEHVRRAASPFMSSDDFVRRYDRTYRNIKCSVSVDTVLRELERDSLDDGSPDKISPQTSSAESGTVSIMFCKDSDVTDVNSYEVKREPTGMLKRPEKENEILLEDRNRDGSDLSRAKEVDQSPYDMKFIHPSYSSPSVVMSSPYSANVTTAGNAKDESDNISSFRTSDSEVVVVRPYGDACEWSSSSEEENQEGREEQQDVNEEEPKQEFDEANAGSPSGSAGRISTSSSLVVNVNSVPSGNALFLLDRSATESELGIEVISLDESSQERLYPPWSDVSFRSFVTEPSVGEPEKSDHYWFDENIPSEVGFRPAKKSGSIHGNGGCHVS